MAGDEEDHWQELLAPTPEYLASLKVFPLIPSLKKDIEVSVQPNCDFNKYNTH
jgi:hypothetical protein